VVAVILGIGCCYSLPCDGPHPEPVRDGSGRTRERTARCPDPDTIWLPSPVTTSCLVCDLAVAGGWSVNSMENTKLNDVAF
jgi:hypothetical protein